MDTRLQRLSCAQNTTVFPENSERSVEPGTGPIRIGWLFEKNTLTYLFMSVILSNSEAMPRGITDPNLV
jgi:hypothetical protein